MRIRWNRTGLSHHDEIPSYDGLFRRNGTVQSAYYCPSCGSELYGEWKYTLFFNFNKCKALMIQKLVAQSAPEYRMLQDEAEDFSRITVCPICGGELKHSAGFFIQNDLTTDDVQFFKNPTCRNSLRPRGSHAVPLMSLSEVFDYLREQRIAEDRKSAAEAARQLLAEYREEALKAGAAQDFSSRPSDLRDYFLPIIQLECGILSLMEYLPELYFQRIGMARRAQEARACQFREQMEPLDEIRRAITAVQKTLKEMEYLPEPDSALQKPAAPVPPNLKLPVFPHWFKIRSQNAQLTRQYEEARDQYEKSSRQYLEALSREEKENRQKKQADLEAAQSELSQLRQEYNSRFSLVSHEISRWDTSASPEFAALYAIESEIQTAQQILKEMVMTLNRFYSWGILYPKYHNLSAAAAFYEYLFTGRCSSLKGTDGAYNLYEGECRSHVISPELPPLLDEPGEKKQGLYILGEKFKEESAILKPLLSRLETACSHGLSADSSYRAAADAYYDRFRKQLTSDSDYLNQNQRRLCFP